jgi:hypothetical protein
MNRARRFSGSSIRWTTLAICLALILSSLGVSPFASASSFTQDRNQPRNDKARRVKPAPPEKTVPFANLPKLDDRKNQPSQAPEAPPSISSTARSKRKPLESRKGKRVGDPGTTGVPGVGSNRPRTESVNERIDILSRQASAQRNTRTRHHATKTRILNRKRTTSVSPVLNPAI